MDLDLNVEKICEGIRNGDAEVMESLYRYSKNIAITRYGLVNSAEDIAQNVAITAWRKIGDYDPAKSSMTTWIYRMIRTKCIDALRKKERKREVGLDDKIEAEEKTECDLERAQRIKEYLDRDLYLDSAETIHLSLIKEMSDVQIARALNTPLGTIKTRIRREKIRIREAFALSS